MHSGAPIAPTFPCTLLASSMGKNLDWLDGLLCRELPVIPPLLRAPEKDMCLGGVAAMKVQWEVAP